jgi:hypothetical protein
MGDVIVWKPVGDVVAFDGVAAAERLAIFDKMTETYRQLQSPHCDTVELNEKLKRLQLEYWEARRDAEIILAVCDAANDQRDKLWREMPEGEPCLILASSPGAFDVMLLAKRKRATVTCTRFAICKRRAAA